MHRRKGLESVFIISELHPQHRGEMADLETMILQSKLAGADAVKIQLYDTLRLHGDDRREYLQIDRQELAKIKDYADHSGIQFLASVFDDERLGWCEDLDLSMYKIASRTVADESLCRAIIATKKPVLMSLGKYPWKEKGFPYQGDNLIYLFCISNYPTLLEEIQMPEFKRGGFLGYSDHSFGIAACVYAVAKGAQYIEKHFTLNKARQYQTEKGHTGSMDLDDLRQLRTLADSLSLLRWAEGTGP
jgi:sialic acid synthase SpsE